MLKMTKTARDLAASVIELVPAYLPDTMEILRRGKVGLTLLWQTQWSL